MSELQLISDSIEDIRQRVRETVLGEYDKRVSRIEREHGELDSALPSPYLDDFEAYYQKRIALGRMSVEQVFGKVDLSIHKRVPDQVREHIKTHIFLKPPTAEEIEEAIRDELRKEADERQRRLDQALEKQKRSLDLLAKRLNRRLRSERLRELRSKRAVRERKEKERLQFQAQVYEERLKNANLPRKQRRRTENKLAKTRGQLEG